MKVRWNNLKDMRCPHDSGIISFDHDTRTFSCRCGFRVGKEKFDGIINSLYSTGKYEDTGFERNLSELNNL